MRPESEEQGRRQFDEKNAHRVDGANGAGPSVRALHQQKHTEHERSIESRWFAASNKGASSGVRNE